MYIHKIILRNVRGFKTLDFDLARRDGSYAGWTVFTGDNGAGKSTLLKAIAMGLVGPDTVRPLQPDLNRWVNEFSPDHSATISLEIKPSDDDASLGGQGAPPKKAFPVTLHLSNGSKQTELKVASTTSTKKSLADRTIWSLNKIGWFSCGYGPFRRVFGASSEATEIMVARSTSPYATMFQEAASLSPADRWLKDLDHKASKNPDSRERKELDLLLALLNDALMPNGMKINRVDADGLWVCDKEGVELSWRDMSDGYRAALALLTDIIRHLCHAHEEKGLDSLLEKRTDKTVFVKSTGVVLIDEIDAHLHPEWQREIGFWLKKHFPYIQFLVTSHSPIICQAADPNGLFVLPEPGSGRLPAALSHEDYLKIISSRPDTILLSPAFGLESTRSPAAVEARVEYARLEGKERSTGHLTTKEKADKNQLKLFVENGEDL